MDNLNNIEVEQIYPQNERIPPAFAAPVRALNNRINIFRDENRQNRREFRDRMDQNDQRVRGIGENVTEIRDAVTTMTAQFAVMRNENAVQPAPILVNAVNNAAADRDRMSVASSAISSRMTSRAPSPGSVDEGLYPLARNLAYSSQVLLKKKEKRYDDAYRTLKKVAPSTEAVLQRVNNTSDNIIKKAKSQMAQFVPEMVGLSTLLEPEEYLFEELPESEISDSNGVLARKEIRKEFKTITGATENLQFLIRTIINRYSKKLTLSQVKDLMISISDGRMKKSVQEAFSSGSVSSAFKFLLSMYGKILSSSDKSSQFHKTKISQLNPVASLYAIYENAQEAYPGRSEEEITKIALIHALGQLPDHVVTDWNSKIASIERMKKLDMAVPEISFPIFIDFIVKTLKRSPKADLTKTVREIGTEEKPTESESFFDKTVSELNDFKRQSIHKESENLKALEEIQNTQSSMIAQLTRLQRSSENPKTTLPKAGGGGRRNAFRKSVNAIHSAYRIEAPGFKKASEGLKKLGTVIQVMRNNNSYNHSKRNKPNLVVKRVSNPNSAIPYEYDAHGRFLPEPGSKITFNVIIEIIEGKYCFTDQLLVWASKHCPKCGMTTCGINSVYCAFASDPITYDMCSCKYGFHSRVDCKVSTTSPDLN